jgi:hypothetical protein
MFTGDPRTFDVDVKHDMKGHYPNGYYKGGNVDKYRLGAFSLGHLPSGYRIGLNSEKGRHWIQNKLIHDNIGAPAFRELNIQDAFYYYWGTNNRYSLWY